MLFPSSLLTWYIQLYLELQFQKQGYFSSFLLQDDILRDKVNLEFDECRRSLQGILDKNLDHVQHLLRLHNSPDIQVSIIYHDDEISKYDTFDTYVQFIILVYFVKYCQ